MFSKVNDNPSADNLLQTYSLHSVTISKAYNLAPAKRYGSNYEANLLCVSQRLNRFGIWYILFYLIQVSCDAKLPAR